MCKKYFVGEKSFFWIINKGELFPYIYHIENFQINFFPIHIAYLVSK